MSEPIENPVAAWWLANRYPEVCRAHAEFGGDDQLEDWLRQYHAAVVAERQERVSPPHPQSNREDSTL